MLGLTPVIKILVGMKKFVVQNISNCQVIFHSKTELLNFEKK